MKKQYKKAFASTLVTTLVLTTGGFNTSVQAQDRLGGLNRYETSVIISQGGWKESSCVVIASGEEFADALCAAPLAKVKEAPILLTGKNSIDGTVVKEIERLKAKKIIIVGGKGAISEDVEKKIKAVKSVEELTRIWGKDRYETSLEVAKEISKEAVDIKDVAIASGKNFPDALSVASIAAQKGMPILLTNGTEMKDEILKYVDGMKNFDKAYIVGGKAVIEEKLESKFKNPVRLAGKDRYETNLKVMEEFKNEIDFNKVYLSRGNGPNKNEFADALAGSPLAAKFNAPVILVDGKLSENMKSFVNSQRFPNSKVMYLGGEKVLNLSVGDTLKIESSIYDEDNKVYGSNNNDKKQKLSGNILITGKNATVQNSEISGNLYINSSIKELSNLKISGILYINSKNNVGMDINNVQAKEIRIVNSSNENVNFKNITCEKLMVEGKHKTKPIIKIEGENKIGNTIVTSSARMDATMGSFGQVSIDKSSQKNKVVEFVGVVNDEVKISDSVNIKTDENGKVKNLVVESNSKEKVNIEGNYGNIKIANNANVSIDEKSKIEEVKAEGEGKNSKVEVEKGAVIEKADESVEFTGEGAKDVGKPTTPENPTIPENPTTPENPSESSKVKVTVNGLNVIIQVNDVKDDAFTIQILNKATDNIENLNQLGKESISNGNLIYKFQVKEPGTYYGFVNGKNLGKINIPEFKVISEKEDQSKNEFRAEVKIEAYKISLNIYNIKDDKIAIMVLNSNKDIEYIGQIDSANIVKGIASTSFGVKEKGTYTIKISGANSGIIELLRAVY